jgi:hypothetical protein
MCVVLISVKQHENNRYAQSCNHVSITTEEQTNQHISALCPVSRTPTEQLPLLADSSLLRVLSINSYASDTTLDRQLARPVWAQRYREQSQSKPG